MEGIAEQFDTLHEERVYQFMEYEAYEAMRQVAICDHQSRVWLLYPDTDRLAGALRGASRSASAWTRVINCPVFTKTQTTGEAKWKL
ncbi:hypothetical protein H2136_19685 [Aeromonas hydrophila]|uniref:Uncharacterized protein n=1 Tax=Aeromonas hydrophila TaxID=644 RepID=A0A926ITT2_AERHY|nr:hypothetical protein [Aeromonas hydrophila]